MTKLKIKHVSVTGLKSLSFKINLSLIVKHKTICSKYENIIRTIKEKTHLWQIKQIVLGIENGTRHQRIYFNFVLNEDK